jgi:tetratricopeptide (TPR) repeat protein
MITKQNLQYLKFLSIYRNAALFLGCFILLTLASCNSKKNTVEAESIKAINLKRGDVILCGPPEQQLGTVQFETSCSEKVKKDFNTGMALLHSFEYDEAEKIFAKIINEEPGCAMAYWGVAMSNYHPLWAPPTLPELNKGAKAIAIAQSLSDVSKRESAYINAIGMFYKDWDKSDHRSRSISFEKAMEKIHTDFPADKEASVLYALSLTAAADPTDKSFSNQKKAYGILTALYPGEPEHPGIVHYIIHSYDYPELAALALPAAKKYAAIAPSSAHAQHMPSHIFTRLGLWDDCISSNIAAASSAKCYAENTGIKGHWDEELHSMDYLVYAYLQKGENDLAKKQWDYLKTIQDVHPVNFKVAYAFAAIPSRYVLENKLWNDAAHLKAHKENFEWEKYPWQNAILHFARLLGSAHTGKLDSARQELKLIYSIYDTLTAQKDVYKANQVLIQAKTGEAWLRLGEGKNTEALNLMNTAVEMEDKTEKHPVTPGEVIPARELLGDMYMQLNQPAKALEAYEANLKKHPNRFNSLYNAGLAAEKIKDKEKARFYYQQLVALSNSTSTKRHEVEAANQFLSRLKS